MQGKIKIAASVREHRERQSQIGYGYYNTKFQICQIGGNKNELYTS